jgi:Gp5 N-terminal OB domain
MNNNEKHFMGRDRFYWFFGRVEDRHRDPATLGRVRVRVIGLHPDDPTLVPTEHLPWAIPIMPVTSSGVNGIGMSSTGLLNGSYVFGFFADGEDAQVPVILGSIASSLGHYVMQSIDTVTKSVEKSAIEASGAVSDLSGVFGANEFGESAQVYINNVKSYKGKYPTVLGNVIYDKAFKDLSTQQQEQFLDAMTKQEGGRPNNLNMRNNNPGNIVLGKINNTAQIQKNLSVFKQFNVTEGDKANGLVYAKFPSLEVGRNAMRWQLSSSSYINLTAAQAVAQWLGALKKK